MVERFHRRLKEVLRIHGTNWTQFSTIVLLKIRASPKEKSKLSTAELVFVRILLLPVEFYQPSQTIINEDKFVKELCQSIKEISPLPVIYNVNSNTNHIFAHPELNICDYVYVRIDRVKKPLECPYNGFFKVLKCFSKYFTIELPNGKSNAISLDRLKLAFYLDLFEVEQAVPGGAAPK